jgi:hypothetical protein
MALAFVLVSKGSNHVTYRASVVAQSTDVGTIQTTGAGDADVALRDAAVPTAGAPYNAGLLKEIVDMTTISTQAIARRQMLDWGLAPVVGDGILNVPGKRCRAYVQGINPVAAADNAEWSLDADVGAGGGGEINVRVNNGAATTSFALITIEAIGTPLQF